jgi:hypothetical protein
MTSWVVLSCIVSVEQKRGLTTSDWEMGTLHLKGPQGSLRGIEKFSKPSQMEIRCFTKQ